MFSLASFALAISAVSSASALVVPRATPPAGWDTSRLEANQTAATTLPSQCLSASASSSASATSSAVTPTPTASEDDEGDDCEEDDGDEETTDIPTSTSTSTPTSTPVAAVVLTTKASTSVEPTTTKAKTSTTSKASSTTSSAKATSTISAASSSVNSGGVATFFYQNGVAGACGTVHSDSALIAAIDKDRYGNLNAVSPLCGDQVKITNTNNGKTVTVTIADACPTCENSNSIDLSVGAFTQIATEEEGEVPTVRRILVVGGNGFIGSAICKAALAKGIQVTSVSSSGLPFRTAKGHEPAWVSKVDWQKGDALHPETFAHLFPQVDGVVHTLGTLIEDSTYKKYLKRGDILGLVGILPKGILGDNGNPLEKSTDISRRGSYDVMNRDTALRVCEAFVASSSDASLHNAPRPFVYISAEDIFRPIIPARYIETKREAEQGIDALLDGRPQYRGVYIRPSLVYHAHHRPLTTPPAVLLDLSSNVHAKIPPALPSPSSVLRHIGAIFSHDTKSTSALDSIANALTIPPIHVDHVAAAVCSVLDSSNPVCGIVGVQRMRELIGWAKHTSKEPKVGHLEA
ncbi:hypothetical protein H0H92_010971 [Tricholoma furcatifolium]|nr:hypothetical protein H0H92_010971 [Tricholoma furcatifolium]